MDALRLQKYLAQAGAASRRSAEALMAAGQVRVNGQVVTSLGTRVDPSRDVVEVEGKRIRVALLGYRVILKPRACLSTMDRPKPSGRPASERSAAPRPVVARVAPPARAGAKPSRTKPEPETPVKKTVHRVDLNRPTLRSFVPDAELGWKVVAPLDYPSEGVVLLTTDGELSDRLSRDGGKLMMTYHVKYQGKVGDVEVGRLMRGWYWESRKVVPESATALATTGKNTWVEIVVREMRPRVIKASGNPIRCSVLKISRVRLGPVSFEGLSMGEHRDLNKAEIASLRKAAGLE